MLGSENFPTASNACRLTEGMGFKTPETARANSATSAAGKRRPGTVQSPNTRMNIEKYLVAQVKAEILESDSKSGIIGRVVPEPSETTTTAATTVGSTTDAVSAAVAENSVGSNHQTNGRQKENVPQSETSTKARKRVRTTRKRPIANTTATTTTRPTSAATAPPNVKALDSKEKFITDYFQPRRSHRRTKAEVIKSNQMQMEDKIIREDESGFEIVKYEDKGRGVIAMIDLKAGDFVLEYAGDLINLKEARRREEQ